MSHVPAVQVLPPSSDTRVPSAHTRIRNYNRFLADVYRKPVRFSELLAGKGTSSAQLRTREANPQWIHSFLTAFLSLLEWHLRRDLPDEHPVVLRWFYGLDGQPALSDNEMARRLRIRTHAVKHTRGRLMGYLRGKVGRRIVEKTALETAGKLLRRAA